MKVQIDQQVNFQTRTIETHRESSKAKNIQIRSLETMTQHSQEETQQIRKEKQGLTQDYLKLQRMIESGELYNTPQLCTTTLRHQSATTKIPPPPSPPSLPQLSTKPPETIHQRNTESLIWKEIKAYAERMRKSKGDLTRLDR